MATATTTVVVKRFVPSMARFLSSRLEEFGFTAESHGEDSGYFKYEGTSVKMNPVERGKDIIAQQIEVRVSAPPLEVPEWLTRLIKAYEGHLKEHWSTNDLQITVLYYE